MIEGGVTAGVLGSAITPASVAPCEARAVAGMGEGNQPRGCRGPNALPGWLAPTGINAHRDRTKRSRKVMSAALRRQRPGHAAIFASEGEACSIGYRSGRRSWRLPSPAHSAFKTYSPGSGRAFLSQYETNCCDVPTAAAKRDWLLPALATARFSAAWRHLGDGSLIGQPPTEVL
jgi:hypothetical protein